MDEMRVLQHDDMTSICIGEASGDMPIHLMTGEKECAYIVYADRLEPWYWDALRDRDGFRFIDFPRIDVIGFTDIASKLRNDALKRLQELARALQRLPKRFIIPSNGFIETWRIWFLPDEGILIFPEQLSQIILYCASEQSRFLNLSLYLRPKIEVPIDS